MAAITEDFVSFEIAKLLKEKGFDELCAWQYYTYWEDYKLKNYEHPILNENMLSNSQVIDKDNVTAPTQQMAMKWLREEHNIAINIGWGEIFEDKFQWWCIILNYKDGSILRESEYYAMYEEACEETVKYCLKHLI